MPRNRAPTRAILLVLFAFALESTTCHAHFCSGDGCDDQEDDDGSGTQTLVLPPFRDPFGRPLTGPILLPVGRDLDPAR